MAKNNRPFDVFPGRIPDQQIFETLGIELEPGDVKYSAKAQQHALRRHPNEVPIIIPHLSDLVTSPLYMGDDLRNPGKIEFVGRIANHRGGALVALTIEKNSDGYYHVCSSYLISQSELDKKRKSQILRIVRLRSILTNTIT